MKPQKELPSISTDLKLKDGTDTPYLLYRYRAIDDNTIDCLKNETIWISSAKKFNDPFEFNYQMKKGQELRQSEYHGVIKDVKDWGVICLNAHPELVKDKNQDDSNMHPDILLMWSHYANSHYGMAIAYRRNCLLQKVTYELELPVLDLDFKTDDGVPFGLVYLLTTKSTHWSYENEYRYINTLLKDKHHPESHIGKIERIYFGIRTTDDDILKVKRAVNKHMLYTIKLEFQMTNFN